LAPLEEWLLVSIFVRITCAMADMALAAASRHWSGPPWHSPQSIGWQFGVGELLRLVMENVLHRNGPFGLPVFFSRKFNMEV